MNISWEVVNSSLQLIQTCAVLAALVYGWQQIRDARRESRLDAAWQIFAEFSHEDQRKARRYIYKNRALFETVSRINRYCTFLPKQAWDAAHNIGNTFNRIGYSVHVKLIRKNSSWRAMGISSLDAG